MIWMPILNVNLILAILLTTVTGAIVMSVWMLVGIGLERFGFIHIRYELMKLTSFFFLCPISYIVLKAYEIDLGKGALFTPTPLIVSICGVMLKVWCGGVVGFITYMLIDIYLLHRKYRDAFACDSTVNRQFAELKEQMGLKADSLCLKRSYRAEIPCVTGLYKPTVILPVKKYTPEELRVILVHEMTHYKQNDLRLKYFTFVILSLHFMNPLAWVLFYQVHKLSEYVCDYRAGRQLGDLGKYFAVLLSMSTDVGRRTVICSQLLETEASMMERVKKMRSVNKTKQRSKFAVAVVLSFALFASTASISAVTVEAAESYVEIYDETRNLEEVASVISAQQAEFIPADQVKNATVQTVKNLQKGVGNILDLEVKGGYRLYMPYVYCKKDDTILVATKGTPNNVHYYIGVEYATGYQYRLGGTGDLSYPFEADQSGYWRVFVENEGTQTVTVNGSYIYND